MCYASTAKVNKISEKIEIKYSEVEIGMPVFMDDIATIGRLEDAREGTNTVKR